MNSHRPKIHYVILLSIVVLLVIPTNSAYTQANQPLVNSVEPDTVFSGRETTVKIIGKDFADPYTIVLTLNGEVIQTLNSRLVSSVEIQVFIPADLTVGSYRLQIQFDSSVDRFPFTVISPETTIESIVPSEFWNNKDVEIAIQGTGFSLSPLVILGNTILENTEVVSDFTIIATVPAHFASGDYELLLLFSDGSKIKHHSHLVIHRYVEPYITEISPLVVYNNKDREIAVSGVGLQSLVEVSLGEYVQSFERISDIQFSFIAPDGFTPGEYPLTLVFEHGTQIASEQKLEVRDPINPEIESIDPMTLINNTGYTLHVRGKNLKDLESVKFGGYTQSVEITGPGIDVHIPASAIVQMKDENQSLEFIFPDDTTLTKEIMVYQSVVPANSLEWISTALLVVSIAGTALLLYHNILGAVSVSHKKKQTAPGSLFVGSMSAGVLLVVLVCGLISSACLPASILSLADKGFRYWVTWFLITTIISLAGILAHFVGYFYEITPRVIPIVIALGLSIVVIAIPILLNQPGTLQWVIWAEVALTGIVIMLGIAGAILVRRALEAERRKGPSDEIILGQVEELLYRKGQVSADEDFPNYPQDRVKTALATYYSIHRNEQAFNEVNLDLAVRLSFQRRDEVRNFSEGFTDLYRLLDNTSEKNELVEKALQRLVEIVRSQMQCTPGESFSLTDVPSQFVIYSFKSPELESILPTPFPFILFLSKTAISPEQIEQLKQIQNELDVPERYAVLFDLGEAATTQKRIRQEFGGLARENIVVFGPRDWLNILINIDSVEEIRSALTKAIQTQVDLSIFSPYQTEAPVKYDMFYGRKAEINTIAEAINTNSIAVLGARRIGKTSTLQAITHILGDRGKLLLYLDCYRINNYQSFFKNSAIFWEEEFASTGLPICKEIDDFPEFVIGLQKLHPDRQIVFQFDEIDRLLAYDAAPENDELMFRMFRALAQQKKCQFLFSGERNILDKLADPHSSFFNFVTPVQLGLFDRRETQQLVEIPMNLIGIKFRGSQQQILDMICEATSGHPNLIQNVCSDVLEILQESRERIITPDLVKKITTTQTYRDTYLRILWSQANPLEKAISVVVCQLGEADRQELLDQLLEASFLVTITQVERGLRYLFLNQVLTTNNDNKLILKPSKFSEFLKAYSLKMWLDTFRTEWEKSEESGVVEV